MHISKKELDSSTHKFRLNLINSISGIKPANLIGTFSKNNGDNLAIISSVVHLGSNPPLLGFVMRPDHEVRRDTLNNIVENGFFTINHINENMIERAHYTATKFEEDTSEFEACKLERVFKNNFPAPYVLESNIQIGLKHVETLHIKVNQTRMIIGEIQDIYLPEEYLDDRGYLALDSMSSIGIGGLNTYYSLSKVAEHPYPRLGQLPDFKLENL